MNFQSAAGAARPSSSSTDHGQAARATLTAAAKIPDVAKIPEPERLPRLRTLFETLHDGSHPLRIALDKLQTLDTIRIIEGKG